MHRSSPRRPLLPFLSMIIGLSVACGDDGGDGTSGSAGNGSVRLVTEADLDTFCGTFCDKAIECGYQAEFGTRDQCVTGCENGLMVPDMCMTDVDRCLADLNTYTCDDIMMGEPPAACDCN